MCQLQKHFNRQNTKTHWLTNNRTELYVKILCTVQ